MNKKWPSIRLGEVIRQEREPVGEPDGYGLPVFGVTNIEGVTHTGIKTSDDLSKYLRLKPGHFVYNPYRINVGSLGLSSTTHDGIVSPAYIVFAPSEKIDARFLYYFLKSAKGNQLINFYGNRGSVRGALRFADLSQIEIPLPSLIEQRRLLAYVEKLVTQIQEARILLEQAVEEVKALLESQINNIFINERIFAFLGDPNVCQIVCGQHLGPEDQADSGIPYITGPADFGHRIAKPARFARVARALAEPGDVLLTVKGAGVGKVNLAPEQPTAIGRQLYALRPNPTRLDKIFLSYVLQFSLKHFRDAMTATTVPGISRNNVQDLKIPCPPIPEQRRIVAELNALEAETDSIKRIQSHATAELDALLLAILDRAFEGEF